MEFFYALTGPVIVLPILLHFPWRNIRFWIYASFGLFFSFHFFGDPGNW
jgi:hypothetical protein